MNHVTSPGVSLTPACFGHSVYTPQAAARCISNVLAAGFKRILIDVYWDPAREIWSLCPASVPRNANSGQPAPLPITSPTVLANSSTKNSSGTRSLPLNQSPISTEQSAERVQSEFSRRQDGQGNISFDLNPFSSFHAASTAQPNGSPHAFTNIRGPSSTSPPLPSDTGDVVQLGSYRCDPSVDISVILDVLHGYFQSTDDTLRADLKYIALNLHAAATIDPSSTSASAIEPNSPSIPSPLSDIFEARLSSYIYTPSRLQIQRSNVNSSWFSVSNSSGPDMAYYSLQARNGAGSIFTSPDGWPTESYLELKEQRRLILGLGTIGPRLDTYDSTGDSDTIFPAEMISNATELNGHASETSACGLFDSTNLSLAASNNSWAIASFDHYSIGNSTNSNHVDGDLDTSDTSLAGCGYSPLLNETLRNTTAGENIQSYQMFVYDSIWSWARGEPKSDAEAPPIDIHGHGTAGKDFRCAVFNATNGGRWNVGFCQDHYLGACRTNGLPFSWQLTAQLGIYSDADVRCSANATFAVPRSSLENLHLLETVRRTRKRDVEPPLVWINLNSLDTQSCWVTGVNATCPYAPSDNSGDSAIVVPTVAAFVVIVIALFTILIKCSANRSKSKRRRRSFDGWDYEGIPS